MVAGLKVGDIVEGISHKVLGKGDYNKKDAKTTVRGTIEGYEGDGKARRWKVFWEKAQKTTIVTSRQLTRPQIDPDEEGTSSSESPESDSSSGPADVPTAAPGPQQQSDPWVVHGLKWKQVPEIVDDSRTQPMANFRIKWAEDLEMAVRTPFHFFFAMFPFLLVPSILENTNKVMEARRCSLLSKREFYQFLGLLYAMAAVDLGERRRYWSCDPIGGLFPAPEFGRFGMGVNRFEEILRNIRFAEATSEATDRWAHVRCLMEAFNDHRASQIIPSWRLCVDERMSAYRPRKGPYYSDSIPHLTKIQRKPKGVGTEFKDCTDGQSRVTLRLDLQEGKEVMSRAKFSDECATAGAAAVLRLTEPWFESARIICADSAYASVETAEVCFQHGLYFIGLVKTAHRRFPKNILSQLPLEHRGDFAVATSSPTLDLRLLALVWNGGKQRKMFIASCGTTEPGTTPAIRMKYTEGSDGSSMLVQKVTPWPRLVQTYFSTANAADVNNHLRQGTLSLEETLITQTWWVRPVTTILGVIEVDAYLAWQALHPAGSTWTHRQFLLEVSKILVMGDFEIDDPDLRPRLRKRKRLDTEPSQDRPHDLVPLSKYLEPGDSTKSGTHQLRCKICHKKASYCCSWCSSPEKGQFFTLCGLRSKRGITCYETHKI